MKFSLRQQSTDQRPVVLSAFGPDGYSLHQPDAALANANANLAPMLGCDAATFAATSFLESIHVLDRPALAIAMREVAEGGMPAKVQVRSNKGDRWLEMRLSKANPALCSSVGHPGAPLVLNVTRDISDQVATEKSLRADREKAESINFAKSRFLANMSHELRTPLNAIIGFSELLQWEGMADMPAEQKAEYVGLIHSSAKHLLNVLNDILDMSKIEAGKYSIVEEPFDVANTISTCCAIMRGQAETRKIRIETGDFSDLPELNGDQRAIKQVMINLLSNAIKFSDDGGEVRVDARRDGRNLHIEVADNGIGIAEEHFDSLGMPFYQADNKYDRRFEGTGLGLSMVFGLVELHQGKVNIHSRKGVGTTVTVILPINRNEQRPKPASDDYEIVTLPATENPDNGPLMRRVG